MGDELKKCVHNWRRPLPLQLTLVKILPFDKLPVKLREQCTKFGDLHLYYFCTILYTSSETILLVNKSRQ